MSSLPERISRQKNKNEPTSTVEIRSLTPTLSEHTFRNNLEPFRTTLEIFRNNLDAFRNVSDTFRNNLDAFRNGLITLRNNLDDFRNVKHI